MPALPARWANARNDEYYRVLLLPPIAGNNRVNFPPSLAKLGQS